MSLGKGVRSDKMYSSTIFMQLITIQKMINHNRFFTNPRVEDNLKKSISIERFSRKKLYAYSYEYATILPCKGMDSKGKFKGGVIDKNKKLIDASEWIETFCVDYEPDNVLEKDDEVIYLGLLEQNIYGHTITDSLKKIWYLKEGVENKSIVYTTINGYPLSDLQLKLYALAGFDLSKAILLTHPTRFRRVIIPDNSLITKNGETRYYTNEFVSTINSIKRNARCPKIFPKKIYLSRTNIKNWKREMGEKSIEKLFQSYGYEVIHPETLDIEEQIVMIANAKTIATTEGSIAHSLIFASPGTEAILIKKMDKINDYQIMINQMVKANATYIECHHSYAANSTYGPFYMTITSYIEDFLGEKVPHIPYYLQFSFYLYSIRSNKTLRNLLRFIKQKIR